ncbi:MAG: polymer-forming cytoskeletal protein [Pseudomonadota bacterium]
MTTTPPKAARPQRAPVSSAPSIIGSDVRIVGNLETAGEIQLDGTIEGDVRSGALTMGENGSLSGSVNADSVIVRGTVDGAIRGRNVVLEKSAKIRGDVIHETLSIEAGAQIDGTFSHSSNPLESSDTPLRLASRKTEEKSGKDQNTASVIERSA